ncbi:MAG: cobalamin biosynthesis protein [Alphaproteobacteria bacterium]
MYKKFFIVVGNPALIPLAKKIKAKFPLADIYGHGFYDFINHSIITTLQHLYQLSMVQKIPIIGLMNIGLMVRAMGQLATDRDKFSAPPILCLASDHLTLVPLLGEHHGGQTWGLAIAKKISLNYAGDKQKADDDIGDNAVMIGKEFLPAWLMAGKKIPTDWRQAKKNQPQIVPKCLVIGIGLERGVPFDVVEMHIKHILKKINAHPESIHSIASIDIKMDEVALHRLSEKWQRPIYFFSAQQLAKMPVPNPSSAVLKETGTPSVAEAACLLLPNHKHHKGNLLLEKQTNHRTTIAISQITNHESINQHAIRLGHLAVVGIGPGDKNLRSFDTCQQILSASDIVGYQLYLDLVSDLTIGKKIHHRPLGKETKRASLALDLALSGKKVALLASGDAGVYALASLILEILDTRKQNNPKDKKLSSLPISISPGISAFQALAAKLGAPAGNDFSVISLSDIMTPRKTILKRIKATLDGDLPLFLYNPKSKTRQDIFLEVIKQARKKLPATTPVVIGKHLYRQDEEIITTNLKDITSDSVDMFSCVMISNHTMRHFYHLGQNMFYAMRGYKPEKK